MNKTYKYFCGTCGVHFTSEVPERDENGLLTGLCCPSCGCYDIYEDTKEGADQSVADLSRYEAEIGSYI